MSQLNFANLKKTVFYLKRNGIRETWYEAKERLQMGRTNKYQPKFVGAEELEDQREKSKKKHMLFSIVVPTYCTREDYLRDMIDSVRAQSYGQWELILADASPDDGVERIVRAYNEERIHYCHLENNGGISKNTNYGIEKASGEYIGLLDHDDFLEPDALYEMAAAIEDKKNNGVNVCMLYSDEDKCDEEKKSYYEPNYKEKFNLDLILTNNYICHFLVMKSGLMKELKLRPEYDGAQDYDLVLRAAAKLMEEENQIVHIPKVLYHWRCHRQSTAGNPQSKLYAYEAGRRALQDFADKKRLGAKAVNTKHMGFYELQYEKDIFETRKDLAAAGGTIFVGGKTAGGRMDEKGDVYYEGTPENYSGYFHRASLAQDAYAVDLRCFRLNPAYKSIFEEITGILYTEDEEGYFAYERLPQDFDIKGMSVKVCAELAKNGARILYLPEWKRKMDSNHNRRGGIGKEEKNISRIYLKSEKTMEESQITVVIPNYNGIRFLEGCIESLMKEKVTPDTPTFDILVVDNGSTDGSERMLREKWSEVQKIFLKKNTGFCHAVNIGIQNSHTPYVILLNNDTKVKAGFIKGLFNAIKREKKIFSVSAKMLMWDNPDLVDDAGDYYCALGWAYGRGKGRPATGYQKRTAVFSACGGAAIYRKSVFYEIGFFDERHFAYLEDLDVGYRARIYGYKNYYEPDAQVVHFGSASTGSRYNDKKTYLSAANNIYVVLKNMPIIQLLLNMPLLAAGFFAKYLFFVKKGMGGIYLRGLARGVRKGLGQKGRKKHVSFKWRHFWNYCRIQLELILNIFRRMQKS